MADTLEMQNPQGGEPLPQGASVAEPLPEGATVAGDTPSVQNVAQQGQQSGMLQQVEQPSLMRDLGRLGKGALEAREDIDTGALKGLGDTVHGIGSMIHKGLEKVSPTLAEKFTPQQGLDALNQMTDTNGFWQKVGFGGEGLLEFMLGDEALKGMSLAEKMANSAKVMQILEKFPKLVNALKMGANVGKVAAELGPEERALLAKYPVLARLVSHGMDAVRQGVVQGAQTTAKTGGDVKQATKEGATMTGVSAALGVPFGVVGGTLAKGGEAAKTVQALNKVAESAPAKTEVAELGGNMLTKAEEKMHTDFQAGIDEIKGLIGDEQIPLKGSPFQKAAEEILQSGEGAHPLERLAGETAPVSDFAKKYIKGVAGAFEKAEPEVAEGAAEPLLVDALGNARNAAAAKPAEEPVTIGINDLIKARQTLGERVRSLGWDSAAERADRKAYDRMIDGIDDTIESLSRQANPVDHTKYMKDAVESIAPGKTLAQLTNQELSQVAQKAAEIQRTTSPSGLYDRIRAKYRATKKLFDDPEARRAVQSVMNGNLDDLGRQLTTGTKSGHVIETITKLIGPENMNKLSDRIFETWINDAATATGKEGKLAVDPDKVIRKWVSLKPNVREALFQMTPDRAKAYEQFADSVRDAASFKKLVKYGLLPATLGTAGVVHGPLAAFFGAVAGLGVESFGKARDILDSIANNPKTWNAVAKAAGAVGSKTAAGVSTATKYGAARLIDKLGVGNATNKTKQKAGDEWKQTTSPLRSIFHSAATPLSQPMPNPSGFMAEPEQEQPQPEVQPQ